jgi:hypothetical protein
MFLTSYNYGIRLIDLVDYTNSNTTFSDVCNKVNDLLTSNCKEEFYVENNDLWNDFIKRFTRRFMYRTLSFDTYLNFCIKLNDVLTSNKVKLNNMYKAKLIEFNPLYNKYITTDIDNENNKTGTKKTDREENGNTTRNETGTNDKKSIGGSIEKTTRTDNLHTTDDTTNNGTEYNLHSDSPRSSVSVDDMFKTDNNYITDAQNKKTNSRNNTTGTQTGTVKNDGNVENHNNENGSFNTDSTDTSVFNSNILSTDNIKDTLVGKQLLYGYDGNPTDLLKKYINFVIDTNEYLLNKIEEECLFMNIIV